MMKLFDFRSPNEVITHVATHFSLTANLNGGFRSHTSAGHSCLLTPGFCLLLLRFLLQCFLNQLLVVERRVVSVHGQQFLVRPALSNFSVMEHHDFVRVLDG